MMRWLAIVAAIAVATSGQTIDYRLPRNLWPEHYDIELRPDFYPPLTSDQFFFDGWVTVHLICETPTDKVYLHYRQMTINTSSVDVRDTTNTRINVISVATDTTREFFIVQIERQLTVGEKIRVSLSFTGPLKRDLGGLYWSQYTEGGETKYMLGTQFEAADARKAFPCMDEPLFRSTFTVSLWRKDPMVALSNAPVASEDNPGFGGWIVTRFEPTNVNMATYLVAFAIANYTHLSDVTDSGFGGETQIGLWTRPEEIAKGHLDYSQSITANMLEYLEAHFNHPYLPVKSDQITIPDFAAGAMENWGLITYRETRLNIDPDYCGYYEKERLTTTIAHELVHQWTGNVVTCEWWDELWLNEGNAQFYEHRVMLAVEPTWDVNSIFQNRVLFRVFQEDDDGTGFPLYNPVEYGDQARFGSITYDKGASVLRMFEQQVLGYDVFQRAMQAYINENQYTTVVYQELLSAWDRQVQQDNVDLPVNVTVAAMTWILQQGFPVIKMSVRPDGVTVDVTQRMFLELPGSPIVDLYPSPYGFTWYVPVTYVTSNEWDTPSTLWLLRNNRTMTLASSVSSTGWVLGNYHSFGYYRVNYDDNNWANIINQLNTDHLVFNESNRALLIHDSNIFGKAGELRQVIGLQATEYLTKEDQWSPWYAADQTLAYVNLMLSQTVAFGKYKEYMRRLVEPIYTNLTWNDRADDVLTTIHLRSLAIDVACKHEHVDCLNNAWNSFSAWRSSPDNLTIIRPDIRRTVICAALSRSLTDAWDFVFGRYQLPWQGPDSIDRARLRDALTCSTDRAVLNNYFTLAATGDARINPSDLTAVMTGIAGTLTGNDVAWNYLTNNWESMSSSRLTVLETVVQRFATETDRYSLEQFFARYPAQSEDEQTRYDKMLRRVNANISWQARNYAEVSGWLNEVVPAGANSILSFTHLAPAHTDKVSKYFNKEDSEIM